MNEQKFPSEEERPDIEAIKDLPYPEEKDMENQAGPVQDIERPETRAVFQTNPQSPLRYQNSGSNMYHQPPRGQDNTRAYYQTAVIPPYDAQADVAAAQSVSRKTPGAIGFAFAASLLSLFMLPMFREILPHFLNAYVDPITYDRESYLLYFLLVLIYGGISAMLAVLGLIFAPVGINRAKRYNLEGSALGSATILISIVSLILLIASIACSLVIFNIL
ncbi:MAG: hypothetical protein GX681_05515 [Clostridiaceae bacterium]|jgi:hypothetical protein|nr:hypothetical protein [Clostridiaceae bacterium]